MIVSILACGFDRASFAELLVRKLVSWAIYFISGTQFFIWFDNLSISLFNTLTESLA